MKLDPAVKKESAFIALSTLVGAVLVQLVFLLLGRWDFSVLLGGIIGWAIAAANFFFMSVTVQRAVASGDEVRAKQMMSLSYTVRTFILLGVIALSLLLDAIHWIPVVAAVFFPRIAIFIRQLLEKQAEPAPSASDGESAPPAAEEEEEEEDGFEKFVGHFAGRINTDYSACPPKEANDIPPDGAEGLSADADSANDTKPEGR